MAKFLVYIPSSTQGIPNLQIKVEAENWMMALQIGRQKVGEKTELGSNIICDFKEDGSVEITDPNTGRAFSIKEIEESLPIQTTQTQPAQTTSSVSHCTPQPKPQQPEVSTPTPPTLQHPETPPIKTTTATPSVTSQKQEVKESQPPISPISPTIKIEPITKPPSAKQIAQYQPIEKPTKKVEVNIEEIKEIKEEKQVGRKNTQLSSNIESIMTSLFSEVYEVYNIANSREEAANYMLDLAMKKIGVEAGSVLYADLSETELSFIAVRGPKSEEIKKYKIPIGKGIVGFCVDRGVSLAISDVSKDKRWFDKISKSIGFPTKSILCAPIQYEGQTIGAIELINKKGDGAFTVDDLSILNYIAHETGEAFFRIEGKKQQK
ncbi:MAG: GAF domain-containing protein [Deltaproteobacteria bacterium]|nr:GAF domain-containing protein [Deltaproteobacteria bacterium]